MEGHHRALTYELEKIPHNKAKIAENHRASTFFLDESPRPTMKDAVRILILLIASLSCIQWAFAKEAECDNKNSVKIVTEEELSRKTGKDGGDIWLSIMGEVYDVTSGRDFYGEGGSYSIFSGRDGSVPFITGVFTPEEAKKSLVDTLSPAQLVSLDQWRKFYADNEKYPLIGLLEGSLYDKDGNPTEELKTVRERIANFDPPKKKERPGATES